MNNISSTYYIKNLENKYKKHLFESFYYDHMIDDEYLMNSYFQAIRILSRMKEKDGKLYHNEKELENFLFTVPDRLGLLKEHDIFKKMVSVQNIYEIRVDPLTTTFNRILFFPSSIHDKELEVPNIIIVYGYYKISYEKDITQDLTEASQFIRDDYYSNKISLDNIGGLREDDIQL